MAVDFTESLTLVLPKLDDQLEATFGEASNGNNKMVIDVAAIHAGLTSNYNMYSEEELTKSIKTWVDPYPKPIILNHDPETEAVGRVMAAKMDRENDDVKTPYIRLQVAISSPQAIEKVDDERYLTGSVGGRAEHALCSICEKDWAAGDYCKHQRGKVYNGKLMFFNLKGISWKEYSFVNVPADSHSGVRKGASTSDEGWVKAVKVLSVNMNNESILQLSESEEPIELLTEMRKKDAHAWYLHLKGDYLRASAYDYMGENSDFMTDNTTIDNEAGTDITAISNDSSVTNEETDVTTEATDEVTEDILAVATQLSTDLATEGDEDNSGEENEADNEDSSTDEEESAEESEETVDTEELSEDSDEETETEVAEDSETDASDEESEDDKLVDSDVNTDSEQVDTDADEADDTEEANPLQATVDKLTEENAKLRKAIHGMLVERVVDSKIALGMVEADNRAAEIEEHSKRTASSLADAIRDLSKLTPAVFGESVSLTVQNRSHAVDADEENTFDTHANNESEQEDLPPIKKVENFFTDVFTGRKASNSY